MKKKFRILLFLLAIIFSDDLYAQIIEPIHWSFSTNKLSNCEFELLINAKIDQGWHLYGQKSYGENGPIPTSFNYLPNSNYELAGKTSEKTLIKKFEPLFGLELNYFEHEAFFKQKIKIKSNKIFEIKGDLEFIACNDITCIPPTTVPFSFKIEGSPYCTDESETTINTINEVKSDTIEIAKEKLLEQDKKTVLNDKPDSKSSTAQNVVYNDSNDLPTSERSWLSIFILGFLGGLAALLTPCVFPMIPMTVSFFTKHSKTRAKGISNAITYALSIVVIYVVLGLSVTSIFGSNALNALSTNIWFNLAFFVLLVIFAISFFGAFEIVLPSSFINKIDSQSERGGLIGIFFMAFTLSLVSFSCTGPIIGTLLVDAAVNGGIKGPFWGMLGFSTALALPFGLFAAFPGWLNSLPKSGGWLNSIKIVLGFLELALALKFASNADLVIQAGIITREVFISLWIIIFGLMGVYLLGGIKFSHDVDLKHLSVPRFLSAILTLSFTAYLIPGLWGAPLNLISGFPPPDFYSESPQGFGISKNTESVRSNTNYSDHKKEHCPNELPCFHDYDEALAYSKQIGKPLMIDFTGWACVNCRKMESQVWTDPAVDDLIRNEVVLVSLYVDDKNELPENEQTIKKLGDRDFAIKSIGNKWSYMQADRYKTNTQPQYILVDNNEQMLTKGNTHYDPDIKKYINWLEEGINEFKKRTSDK